MSFPLTSLIFGRAAAVAKNLGGRTLLLVQAHSPEICIGAGITGFFGTIGATVHATNKTHDILEEKEELLAAVDEKMRSPLVVGYSREDYEKDVRIVKRSTRKKLIRAWIPVGTLGAASVISVLSGYRILNGRYAATAAAYKTLEAGYDRLRDNVKEKYGEEELRHLEALSPDEVKAISQKQAEARGKTGQKARRGGWEKCGQVMVFDDYSEHWRRYWTPDMALEYLRIKNNQLYDILKIRGHLFVNEIADMLGLPRTAEGQVEGYIDVPGTSPERKRDILGLDRLTEEQLREILSTERNDDIRIPLYIEPDGIVFDLIGKRTDAAPLKLDKIPEDTVIEF